MLIIILKYVIATLISVGVVIGLVKSVKVDPAYEEWLVTSEEEDKRKKEGLPRGVCTPVKKIER